VIVLLQQLREPVPEPPEPTFHVLQFLEQGHGLLPPECPRLGVGHGQGPAEVLQFGQAVHGVGHYRTDVRSGGGGGFAPKGPSRSKLPKGVHFHANPDGTPTISGTPTSTKHKSAVGTYPLTITATFGKGKSKVVVTQAFTLTVT
jgi:putative Ig domain-containing protein